MRVRTDRVIKWLGVRQSGTKFLTTEWNWAECDRSQNADSRDLELRGKQAIVGSGGPGNEGSFLNSNRITVQIGGTAKKSKQHWEHFNDRWNKNSNYHVMISLSFQVPLFCFVIISSIFFISVHWKWAGKLDYSELLIISIAWGFEEEARVSIRKGYTKQSLPLQATAN